MSHSIPNQAVASFLRQGAIYAADWDAMVAALAGDGVLAGLTCSAQGSPNMTVAVAAGQGRIGGYYPYVIAQNASIAAAHSTLPRFDLISLDYNGTITVTQGTAAAAPISPNIPSNSISLAQVYVAAGATSISSAAITDKRFVLPDDFDIYDEFTSNALVTTGNLGELAWGTVSNGTPTLAFQTGVAKHPGVIRITTGATSGNDTRLHLGASGTAAVMFLASDIARVRTILQLSSAVSTMRLKFGYGVDVSDVGSDTFGTAGAWWEFNSNDSNKWQTETRNASSTTTNTDGGADVAQSSWYQLEIVQLQNGNLQFAKNGALLFTHSATLPSVACNPGFVIETNTTAARSVDIDFFGLNLAPLGNRWT